MSFRSQTISFLKKVMPSGLRAWLVSTRRKYRLQWPRTGSLKFGDFSRLTPVSPFFGFDRGMAIDRYYIEKFLDKYRADVQGRALEMGDPFYINKFGDDRVSQIDVLHVTEGNPDATIVADLTRADHIPSDSFDCIIFTQSLQMIYDLKAALRTLHRILKPGGVLLMTTAGIAKIARRLGRDDWGEYWHLTTQSVEMLLKETFPGASWNIETYGNVFSAISFLHGLASEELSSTELDYNDPDFEVIVSARVVKGGNG